MQKVKVQKKHEVGSVPSRIVAMPMADDLKGIDLQACPAEFQRHFRDLIDAWSSVDQQKFDDAGTRLQKQCRNLRVGKRPFF